MGLTPLRWDEHAEWLAEDLGGTVAKHPLGGHVPEHNSMSTVRRNYRVGYIFRDCTEVGLRVAQKCNVSRTSMFAPSEYVGDESRRHRSDEYGNEPKPPRRQSWKQRKIRYLEQEEGCKSNEPCDDCRSCDR
jgi:hypothetical protein